MQNQSLDEVLKQNQELKELLLKLNQDKQMFEKKVQRKTQELQKLKQSYEFLSDKILTQKHLLGNVEAEQDQLLQLIVEQLISMIGQKQEGTSNSPCTNDICKVMQVQLQQNQEQQKQDFLYYSKKIRQNEEVLQEIKQKYENQIKELNEQNQILKHKLDFLIGKTVYYHEAILDLNQQVSEVHYLRISLQENQKKVEEDLMAKSQQKIAQLEVRNNFLIDQVKSMEQELVMVEKLVTNIEQQTMQTKKRGK
ncbi:unnamed protein product [Paramecium pentaurelia]|uniref:Uncharacterized protein n=1 Tax=Paramecium pentaurelia TaxID=43138 RepID=A0A8S1W1F7_9CILI|nr:unnamed protein product [Paramecium pentaurelia]